ncbi:MAG: tetratricopeptide repeat protein [Kibdelosporangium sp.]
MTITAELGLSSVPRSLGDLAQALGVRCWHLFRETCGAEHPFTLVSAINLGLVLRAPGAVREAHDLDRETMTTLHRIFGLKHPIALVCGPTSPVTCQRWVTFRPQPNWGNRFSNNPAWRWARIIRLHCSRRRISPST